MRSEDEIRDMIDQVASVRNRGYSNVGITIIQYLQWVLEE